MNLYVLMFFDIGLLYLTIGALGAYCAVDEDGDFPKGKSFWIIALGWPTLFVVWTYYGIKDRIVSGDEND